MGYISIAVSLYHPVDVSDEWPTENDALENETRGLDSYDLDSGNVSRIGS
jgi:hypothetical protein